MIIPERVEELKPILFSVSEFCVEVQVLLSFYKIAVVFKVVPLQCTYKLHLIFLFLCVGSKRFNALTNLLSVLFLLPPAVLLFAFRVRTKLQFCSF